MHECGLRTTCFKSSYWCPALIVQRIRNRFILSQSTIKSFAEKRINILDLKLPSPFLLALEPLRALSDYAAGLAGSLEALPRGDGHPVVVFPGLGVSGAATAVLRTRLAQLGYEVYDWEQGVNTGPGAEFNQWIGMLGEHLRRIHAQHRRRISLIGWSLGGIYARELAKRHPRWVRQIITLATPFGGNPEAINAMYIFSSLHGEAPDLAATAGRFNATGSEIPSTSIYSQTDGIVAWEACVGPESKRHRNIEVNGVSHLGMATHPEVLRVLAMLLNKETAGSAE
jgi:hypothetical protein